MRLELASTPEAVPRAVRFAELAADEAGFPNELTDRMLLAAGEAVANAVEHGNGTDHSRLVTLQWSGTDHGGWLSVEDEGAGLAIEQIEHAKLPEDPLQTGGRGLYIIRELTDDIKLEADGRRLMLWFSPRMSDTP